MGQNSLNKFSHNRNLGLNCGHKLRTTCTRFSSVSLFSLDLKSLRNINLGHSGNATQPSNVCNLEEFSAVRKNYRTVINRLCLYYRSRCFISGENYSQNI
uniref:Uncharacterized protein n=1 Tax=Micrurus lemniscatus lemniscatus TaxID=129467 RepID=A0A2D4J291_MICLE